MADGDRYSAALAAFGPLVGTVLGQCVAQSLQSATDKDGTLDEIKFHSDLQKCLEAKLPEHDRVTLGKAASIAQAIFIALLN